MSEKKLHAAPKKPRNRIDGERAMELYRAGVSDAKIAKALDVAQPTVFAWRRRNQLPPTHEKSTGKEIMP